MSLLDAPGGENAHIKGDFICRPAWWLDVVKYLTFNIALHALTVRHPAGARTLYKTANIVKAILLPYSGIGSALMSIGRYARGGKDALEVAKESSALCIVRPGPHSDLYRETQPTVINIHGQHSAPSPDLWNHIKAYWQTKREKTYESISPALYHLIEVPDFSALKPFYHTQKARNTSSPNMTVTEGNLESLQAPLSELQICCNYSIIKIIAAISQTLYGSYELYRARESQIAAYGFAAYSLSVIPYVIMSLVNLVAALIEPEYPMMYLVHDYSGGQNECIEEGVSVGGSLEYEWQTSCAVGVLRERLPTTSEERDKKYAERKSTVTTCSALSFFIAAPALIAAPYVIIHLLTGFRGGETVTTSQKAWLMSWLVLGQVFGLLTMRFQGGHIMMAFGVRGYSKPKGFKQRLSNLISRDITPELLLFDIFTSLVLSVATLGGFVVVSKMILQDDVCAKI